MPHVGRIPSTLEKYRHALSAYLEDVTQLNMKSSNSYSFLYFDDNSAENLMDNKSKGKDSNPSTTPIPDTETRINSSYNTVKKQLDLLSSYFSLIHDDLHGDLLLLRTNLNLLPSNTLHIAQQNNLNNAQAPSASSSSLHIISDLEDDDIDETRSLSECKSNFVDDNEDEDEADYFSSPHHASAPLHPHTDDCAILNTKQTQSIQCIVSILQKFVKYNAILVEYIQQNRSKIDSFWVQNLLSHHGQIHKLNLDVESIVSTMCVKDLIHTKAYSCHNILFHDILGCANTKQFFTRIYFIVSIWYSFFHSLHLDKYHEDDEDTISQSSPHATHKHHNKEEEEHECESNKVKQCNSYLTKLFAMTDFSFLTKTSVSSPSASGGSSSSSRTLSLETNPSVDSRNNEEINPHQTAGANHVRHSNNNNDVHLQSTNSRQISTDSNYNWSSCSHEDEDELDDDRSCSHNHEEREVSLSADSSTSSKNDFLLKYLNAQNNYLQSIWHDGIALLEYSLHLLQQQEFRLSCRVAHRCLELFQKQQVEQERLRHQQQQQNNWDNLNRDLYGDNATDDDHAAAAAPHAGLFMVDPITNQPAQIPGLWYIEMHLANCYHTWGQSNMALYHINRTLDQLGNYQINPDTLTVRLNTRRKFRLLSSYLVQQTTQKVKKKQRNKELKQDLCVRESSNKGGRRRNSFMRKIKINNRRRRKSNMFSKLFDRFSGSRKKKKKGRKAAAKEAEDADNYGSSSHSQSALSLIDDENENETEQKVSDYELALYLEEDLDIKMEQDTDNEDENKEEDDEDDEDELEELFFHNDTDTGDEENSYNGSNTQMITLEALLSMHMTKGRILIEMKLLREALNLYTYIINECESLIKYHWLINPHHIQLEAEYDEYSEHKAGGEETSANSSSSSPRRRRRRRRSSRADNDMMNNEAEDDDVLRANHNQIPPNTPYRRLTKNIGLENYYAARGDIYFKFKDLKNALKDFSNAIKYGKCKKEMGIYYNLRGVCYHEMKQYERALKDYDNAVKSMYGNHVAWNNRAALLVDMGQYDDAIENANNAIKLDPSYGNAYKHRGVAYHLKCQFEKAITDINRCIKLLPNYRPARLALLAIWKDIFSCARVLNVEEGFPLDLVKIVVDYTVGNGYEIDEYMVNFTYC